MNNKLSGVILSQGQWVEGDITIEKDRIKSINGNTLTEAQALATGKAIIVPGFIDCHIHGGGGADFMEGYESAVKVVNTHIKFGTTALLATTMTAPTADIDRAFAGMGQLYREQQNQNNGSRVIGVHLEGPYINSKRLGAQPDYVVAGHIEDVKRWSAQVPIKSITIAPEVYQNMVFIKGLTALGIKVQIGHSQGTYEDGVAALNAGAHGFTHLFNAMTGLHHRDPGIVGAALAHAEYAEIIFDLLHVHPGAFWAANRAIPNLYCVTDSTAATGMPDGEYKLGRQPVFKCMGGVRLEDGTLAGSVLTLDLAVRNLVSVGIPLAKAIEYVSTRPAKYLNASDIGELSPNKIADCVVLNSELNVQQVMVKGEFVE